MFHTRKKLISYRKEGNRKRVDLLRSSSFTVICQSLTVSTLSLTETIKTFIWYNSGCGSKVGVNEGSRGLHIDYTPPAKVSVEIEGPISWTNQTTNRDITEVLILAIQYYGFENVSNVLDCVQQGLKGHESFVL